MRELTTTKGPAIVPAMDRTVLQHFGPNATAKEALFVAVVVCERSGRGSMSSLPVTAKANYHQWLPIDPAPPDF